jgi:hypothetical protein
MMTFEEDRMPLHVVRSRFVACASLLAALACGGDGSTSANGGKALVEFFNLSGTPLSISAGGFTDSEFPGRFCLNVDPSTPDVVMTATSSGTRVTNFTPSFRRGRSYTVFIIDNPSGGVRFVTASSDFTPASGSHGLRFFNAAGAAYDVYVSAADVPPSGTPTLRNVAPATASGYASVPGGSYYSKATNAGTQAVAFAWDWRTYPAGQKSTLFIAPTAGFGVISLMPDCVAASTQPAS